jgi:hypothetical protein
MDLRSDLIKEIKKLEKYAKEYEDDIPNVEPRIKDMNLGKVQAYRYAALRLRGLLNFYELPKS